MCAGCKYRDSGAKLCMLRVPWVEQKIQSESTQISTESFLYSQGTNSHINHTAFYFYHLNWETSWQNCLNFN